MSEQVPTPMWLRVFACASFAVVAGGIVWMFTSNPRPRSAPPVAAPAVVADEVKPEPPLEPRKVEAVRPTPIPAAVTRTMNPPPAATPAFVAPIVQAVKIPPDVIANWQTPDGPELAAAFATQWATTDPASAGKWLAAQPDSPARHAAAEAVAAVWSKKDLNATTLWALALPDAGVMKTVVLERLAEQWAERDPVTAAGYYARLPEGEARKVSAGALFDKWGQRDPAGLYGALTRIPAAIADEARMSLAPVLFPRSAPDAMTVLCGIKEREQRVHSLAQMFDYWRRRNRAAAVAWLVKAPVAEDERQRISSGL